ncbi:immunity protein Imm33 domain-containing protein [Acinetobacter oleivorans]
MNTLEDDSEDIEYEAIYAFQLLYLRPEIMSVLILPPEFIVLVDKNTIEKVINEKNEVVWS